MVLKKQSMKILKLEFKNIGSFGEKIQTIDYSKDGQLILIKGDSGVGKTTYLNILKLLLFGRADDIKKIAISNRINKNGWIRGYVQAGPKIYIIERGFQPTFLNLFNEDGTTLDMVGIKDAQEFISSEIVKMPYTLFSNIVSLSLLNFKSFLKMSPNDRREIIDRVFSLEAINDMYELVKKDMKEISSCINADNSMVYALSGTVEKGEKEMSQIRETNDASISSTVESNMLAVKELSEKISDIDLKTAKVEKVVSDLTAIEAVLKEEKIKKGEKKKEIKKKIQLFSMDVCPTCGTSFSTSSIRDIKDQLDAQLAETEDYMSRIDAKSASIAAQKKPYVQALVMLREKKNSFSKEIMQVNASNEALKSSVKNNADFQSIQNLISSTQASISETKERINANIKKLKDLDILQSLFSIDGVKRQVIDNYLPKLNFEIKETLIRLNFPYLLTFDDTFNSHIMDLGEEISAETLSMGEHKRVDLAVLCAIFKLIKRKYPSINIFTLDEVLSSIDPTNSAEILKYLKEFSQEEKVNIYVISHITMSEDLFDDCIEIYKENRFSDIRHFNSEV